MIPDRAQVQVDSTVSGAEVAMSIDAEATVHIMNVVTDLYADPELACVREYATNAADAHAENGQTRPIEVSTPTDLRPLLTIRDFGPGLDFAEIENVYSKYGASTKRGTNDAVGMLGLGCKSALSYTDQFVVVGIVGGNRIVVSVSRDETGAGSMTEVESGPTDDPDGVEVQIASRPGNSFEAKAELFFSYWPEGSVLLNGEEPPRYEGKEIVDGFTVVERNNALPGHRYNRLTVVMGSVPYPVPDDYRHRAVEALPGSSGVILRVPIGSVQFAPSREALQDHPATRRALDAALDAVASDLTEYARGEIESADNKPAAALTYIELGSALGWKLVEGVQWRGHDIPTRIGKGDARLWHAQGHTGYGWAIGNSSAVHYNGVEIKIAGRALWVTDYTNAKWTATQRRKLDRYAEYHKLLAEPRAADICIVSGSTVPMAEWIDGAVQSISWDTVKAWRDPDNVVAKAQGGGRGSYAGTYPVSWDHASPRVAKEPAANLPDDDSLLYALTDGEANYAQKQILPDSPVVTVTTARLAKFKRLFPKARRCDEAATAAAAEWLDGLTEGELTALRFNEAGIDLSMFAHFDAAKLDDPRLALIATAAKVWEESDTQTRWNQTSYWRADDALDGPEVWTPEDEYPILGELNQWRLTDTAPHAILYLNAAYAANKGGSPE